MTMRMADVDRSTFWMMGMALLQVLTIVQFEHAACGHHQRAAKGKKAMQKSELSLGEHQIIFLLDYHNLFIF
jgi:hypothetical protein